jgi:hypothetical protein
MVQLDHPSVPPRFSQGVAIMSRIRQHYFFPPRTWRIAALRCSSAATQFNLHDPSQLLQRRSPAHSALHLVRDLNCPFDMTSLIETQRENIDALTAANQLAYDGMQALVKKQPEMFNERVQEIQAEVQKASAGNPVEGLSQRGELS